MGCAKARPIFVVLSGSDGLCRYGTSFGIYSIAVFYGNLFHFGIDFTSERRKIVLNSLGFINFL